MVVVVPLPPPPLLLLLLLLLLLRGVCAVGGCPWCVRRGDGLWDGCGAAPRACGLQLGRARRGS